MCAMHRIFVAEFLDNVMIKLTFNQRMYNIHTLVIYNFPAFNNPVNYFHAKKTSAPMDLQMSNKI